MTVREIISFGRRTPRLDFWTLRKKGSTSKQADGQAVASSLGMELGNDSDAAILGLAQELQHLHVNAQNGASNDVYREFKESDPLNDDLKPGALRLVRRSSRSRLK